jgi:2-dehydro-3-deoxyphosphogluconate aldolase/(4S)-4-hydroxy-2-oxoglutarate aldolase
MSPLTTDDLADILQSAVVLPVLRAADPHATLVLVEQCASANLPIVELTTTTEGWSDAVRQARAAWPSLVVGVGTVLEPKQAEAAVDAGAAFIVSPCPVPDVRGALAGRLPFIEGGFTPGELLGATARGLAKFFPASVGTTQMLRSVLALRPHARIVPTGGIGLDDIQLWIQAGALAVGVGSGLLEELDLPARVSAVRSTIQGR